MSLVLKPDKSKGFEVYVDASFVGDWDPETADWDGETAKSRMGYIFLFCWLPYLVDIKSLKRSGAIDN